jgi:hypothetical protein
LKELELKYKKLNSQVKLLLFFWILTALAAPPVFSQDEEMVTIYDDFDDGVFGRSEYRSVHRSVTLSAFSRFESLSVASPGWEETNHLTAVVLSAARADEIRRAEYDFITERDEGVYNYNRDGLEFSFSLEKPDHEVLSVLEEYYKGSFSPWLESVRQHYEDNYIIRIYSAENVFEPWNNLIQYNEALLMATILGDREQWLWGIHDGLDLLNR